MIKVATPLGSVNPYDYRGAFKEGYRLRGQNVGDSDVTEQNPSGFFIRDVAPGSINQNAVIEGAVNQLGTAYAQEYEKRTRQKPSQEQFVDFLSRTITPSFASGVISGEIGVPQMMSRYVNPELGDIPTQEEQAKQQDQDLLSRTSRDKLLSDYIQFAKEQGVQDINEQSDIQRGRLIDEAGARSRQPGFSNVLNLADQERARSIGNLIKSLRGQQAGTAFDTETRAREFGANLGLQKQQLGLQKYQTQLGQQNLEADRTYSILKDLQDRSDYNKYMDKMESMNKPGTLEYLNTAFSGLTSIGNLMASLKGSTNPASGKTIPMPPRARAV